MTMNTRQAIDSDDKRALIMDDELSIRQVLGEMLRLSGYHCSEAVEGAEAVALFRKAAAEGRPFDVVIMDLTVPEGLGGAEAVQQLLAIDPAARVIVASGSATDPAVEEYHRYGFSGALRKPFRFTELQHLIGIN
jgi:CheY-like chemotaxis protein